MYAIIESCGRQYKVEKGNVVFFEKLDAQEDKKVTFDNVLLVSDNGKVQVGNPYVKGVKVEGKVVAHGKGKKVIVFKMKPKKNYRRTYGHRQPYTKVEITAINTGSTTKTEKTETATKKTTTAKAEATAKKTSTTKVEATTKKATTNKTTTSKKSTTTKTTETKKTTANKTTTKKEDK